jgi:DNA-binding NarL/FixJ family response regulator
MPKLPAEVPTALAPADLPLLSPRELDVVLLLTRQLSTTQISATLSVSVNTVRTRVRRVLWKLGVDDREGAVQTARDRGLV